MEAPADQFVSPNLLEHCIERTLNNPAKWTLQGHSKAGERTGFWLNPLRIVLDAGVVTNRHPNAIFITHSHVDHSWNLPWIYGARTPLKGYENLQGRPVFAPKSAWPMLTQLEHACHNLSVGFMEDLPTIMVEQRVAPFLVGCGETLTDIQGLKGIVVETLQCYHPAETVGYGFSIEVQKLKAEFSSLTGKEIGLLKKKGTEVTDKKIEPQLIFFGDTTVESLDNHEEWKKYPVIVIEFTKAIGHMHWDSLVPYIEKHQEISWVLIHSSQSLTDIQLRTFEKEVKEQKGISNFFLFGLIK